MSWSARAQRKRGELFSLIPTRWQLHPQLVPAPLALPRVVEQISSMLDEEERTLTESSTDMLLSALREGVVTARETLLAFEHRASLAMQFTNCLSEICFDSALLQADDLDAHLRNKRAPVGPLHGLPVSIADRFNLQGQESACGLVSWLGGFKTDADEGLLVKRLRTLGAVVYCKTSVPMSMMVGETTSNIIGSTLNPYDRNLSAGGACGGEGALIACRGSTLGLATDVAGSSRIPCSFNGLYGLKTSEGRLPSNGIASVTPASPVAAGSIGLMSGSLSLLIVALKSILETRPWEDDVETLKMQWQDESLAAILRRKDSSTHISRNKLVFAIMNDDDAMKPTGSVQTALDKTASALKSSCYEIIDWNPPSHQRAVEKIFTIFGSTSLKGVRDAIDASGEPPIPQLRQWYDAGDTGSTSTAEFWQVCDELYEFRKQYATYWAEARARTESGRIVDGLITPVAPQTASKEGEFHYFSYSALVNALDYAAGAFPVMFNDYGLPVGLQVVCQRHQEEKVLGLMEVITEALQSGDAS